jgi:hypothetical protein
VRCLVANVILAALLIVSAGVVTGWRGALLNCYFCGKLLAIIILEAASAKKDKEKQCDN